MSQHHEENVITDQEDIFNHLIQRNQKHFSQDQGTPFTQEPLRDIMTPQQISSQHLQTPHAATQYILQYI